MRILFILMFVLAGSMSAKAQSGAGSDTTEAPYTIVERMPAYPGGDDKMNEFIRKNIHYTKQMQKQNPKGVVYVTFVVEKDGAVSNVHVLRGIAGAPALDQAAVDVTKKLHWEPGTQSGRIVRVQYNLPIRFR